MDSDATRQRSVMPADVLHEQLTYYRARASEYDEWFVRAGRYDRGPEHRREWQAEGATVERALSGQLSGGDVLELACGTGLWTPRLADSNRRVVAVDAAPEAIAINRARTPSDRVHYVVADLFRGIPFRNQFDAVFFGFWLSHVPADRFDAFWEMVHAALKPQGKAFWVDSLYEPASNARDHAPLERAGTVRRRLNDGREFRVVKMFYEPEELEQRVTRLGFAGWVRSSGRFFHYGCMSPQQRV